MAEPDNKTAEQLLARGIDLFNCGEYFLAHEVLEELWRDQPEPERQLTQVIIQFAVGLYHHGRGNFAGAGKLYERAQRRLAAYEGPARGVDLHRLRMEIGKFQEQAMQTVPPEPLPKL